MFINDKEKIQTNIKQSDINENQLRNHFIGNI